MAAKVKSILEKNDDIRKSMLKKKNFKPLEIFHYYDTDSEYQNNFDASNTNLNIIANKKYLSDISLNNLLNKDRFLSQKYITPGISYNSNPQVENAKNGRYEHETGRIADDFFLDKEVKIVDSFDKFEDIDNNNSTYYLKKQFEATANDTNRVWEGYTPEEGKKYIQFSQTNLGKDKNNSLLVYNKNNEFLGNIIPSDYELSDDTYEEFKDGDNYSITLSEYKKQSLLEKTNTLYKTGNISSIINRYYTGGDGKLNKFDSAKTKEYGNSRGRNLLRKNGADSNGNPYVRVWTKKNPYGKKLSTLIRPYFTDGATDGGYDMNSFYRPSGSTEYLKSNTVLGSNGFVNIAPKKNDNVDIKKCMFSIENLAWKDVPNKKSYLSTEQRGPNGGRIMWFPPYDLTFNETANANWNSNEFIGRGERVYTYTNSERTGNLSFSLLIDHPTILNYTKGMDQTHLEDDILRFFAGEQILRLKENESTNSTADKEKQTNKAEEEATPNIRNIKFKVYFPHNYSGVYFSTTENEFKQLSYFDDDWYLYLLIGKDLNVEGWQGEGIHDEWCGYEMYINNGLNTESSRTNNPIYEWINVEECSQWKERNPKVIIENYYFRNDFDMSGDAVSGDTITDYKDINSSQLNSYISNNSEYSFAEVMIAILYNNPEYCNYASELESYLCDECDCSQSKEKINILKAFFKNQVKSIIVQGNSVSNEGSSKNDGSKNSNCTLADNRLIADRRSIVVKDTLKSMLKVDSDKISTRFAKVNTSTGDLEADKKYKYVEVEISLDESSSDLLSDNADGLEYSQDSSTTESGITNLTINTPIAKSSEDNDIQTSASSSTTPTEESNPIRYENESEYFERISEGYVKEIKEKVKNFNPAFHSISPEGFNARLTFLHQCTRQGHTMETTDNNYSIPAGNMSFGRMPVCVLRIGDFINTRIIIENVNIQYDNSGMAWDLNPEGIGVQPMYAKITLSIKILGGQSLSGPISRLQNAVSFNYYANTGVYDDRADIAEMITDDKGNVTENYKRFWSPLPNKTTNNE